MDEQTLWEIIEGFSGKASLPFTVYKRSEGWQAFFGWVDNVEYPYFHTRKEALIHAIIKLKMEV